MDQKRDAEQAEVSKSKAPLKLWGIVSAFVMLIIIGGWIGLAGGCYGNDGADVRRTPAESVKFAALTSARE